MQDDEPENDKANALKVHNVLNNIKDDSKPSAVSTPASSEAGGLPELSGPGMTA